MFNFFRNCHTVFRSGHTILNCTGIPVSPHPFQHLLFSVFWTAAILMVLRWCIMVRISFFMCSLFTLSVVSYPSKTVFQNSSWKITDFNPWIMLLCLQKFIMEQYSFCMFIGALFVSFGTCIILRWSEERELTVYRKGRGRRRFQKEDGQRMIGSVLLNVLFCQGLTWWLMCYGDCRSYIEETGKVFLNVEGTAVFIYTSTFVNSLEIPVSSYLYIFTYEYLMLNVMNYDLF